MIFWKILDREGRAVKRDKELYYAQEILITKSQLEDKVQGVEECGGGGGG